MGLSPPVSRYRRAALGAAFGYTPGEQPQDSGGWLKLNSNESPLPPSSRVAAAVAEAAADLTRYPDPYAEPLRSALARHHGVTPDQVFVANGADQVLDCCYRAFASPGDSVVRTEPSYSLLPVLATMFSAHDVALPIGPGGALPAEFGARPAVLRIVVNPNSPTGHWIEPSTLEANLHAAPGIVAIDEAYCDFAPASCIPLLAAHPSWLVIRTLSKSHALAGLRVGYALGDRDVIADLNSVKDSYPVDRCAIAGAVAALEDGDHHALIVDTVRQERARITDALSDLGWSVEPSAANFVFARPPHGVAAADVAERLRGERILVRHFPASGLGDRLRISIGDRAATDRLLGAIARIGDAR
jgi:histidinol-phosphate aminotransferase